ncbi:MULTISPECIES: hypothetical protein [Arthrobacter]|uniref:Dolichyl-phosphate-mannose-protein mannosyltransferase n=2 Tax=Arthrobacter TaxID=1663 RepID=A0ABU9KLD0_9MICC|nr:hypothetical protein [Arthrobacter sp. YJM1]MDP5227705.1 hypothetical protein [Arthrobacter sp. YJM1]
MSIVEETRTSNGIRTRRRAQQSRLRRITTGLSRTFGPGTLRPAGFTAVAPLMGFLSALFMVVRLFVPGPVGMADQGDGQRLLCSLGVMNVRPWDYENFTRFIHPQWVPHQYYGEGCAAGGPLGTDVSSQWLLLWPAKWLTGFLVAPGLDTRVLGAVCCLAFGLLITALMAVLPGRRNFRILIAGLVTVVSADGVFADFFIAPYSESGAFLGALALVVALLHYWNGRGLRPLAVLWVLLAASFTIGTAPQAASWLPVVVLALFWTPAAGRDDGGSPRPARGRLRRFALPLTASLLLGAFTVGVLATQSPRTTELTTYNAVFAEMLPHSPTPEDDLRWLGADPALASATGSTVVSANSAVYSPRYQEFRDTVSPGKIAAFYLTHPERLIGMAERGIEGVLTPELGYLGSYPQDSGHQPSEKDRRFPPVLFFFTALRAFPVLYLALNLAVILVGLALASRHGSAVGRVAVLLTLASWAQFWAVMLSGGQAEIYKDLIVTGYMSALTVPLFFASACLLGSRARTAGPGGDQSSQPSSRSRRRRLNSDVTS